MVVYTLEVRFAKWACDRPTEDFNFDKKKIIFSDEPHFALGGYVNKKNCRIWDTENPHAYIEKPKHPKRVTACCEFWSRSIIGPYFFENEQEETVTINGVHYRAMLNEFLFTKIEEEVISNIWFQQDDATRHIAEGTLDVFLLVFETAAAKSMSFSHLGAAV